MSAARAAGLAVGAWLLVTAVARADLETPHSVELDSDLDGYSLELVQKIKFTGAEYSRGIIVQRGEFLFSSDDDYYDQYINKPSRIDRTKPRCYIAIRKYYPEEKLVEFAAGTKFPINRVVAIRGPEGTEGSLVSLLDDREFEYIACFSGSAKPREKMTVGTLVEAFGGRLRVMYGPKDRKPQPPPKPGIPPMGGSGAKPPAPPALTAETLQAESRCLEALADALPKDQAPRFTGPSGDHGPTFVRPKTAGAAKQRITAPRPDEPPGEMRAIQGCRWISTVDKPELRADSRFKNEQVQLVVWNSDEGTTYFDVVRPDGCLRAVDPYKYMNDKQQLASNPFLNAFKLPGAGTFYSNNPYQMGCLIAPVPFQGRHTFVLEYARVRCDQKERLAKATAELAARLLAGRGAAKKQIPGAAGASGASLEASDAEANAANVCDKLAPQLAGLKRKLETGPSGGPLAGDRRGRVIYGPSGELMLPYGDSDPRKLKERKPVKTRDGGILVY